jgi:regulatory protein
LKEKHLPKDKKHISVKEAIKRMASFCAYQERCQAEVRAKLTSEYDLNPDEIEFIIAELISQGFINEERFAKIYAGSKFRVKKWGKLKIEQALKQFQLTNFCIEKGLAEITDEEYETTLREILVKKSKILKENNPLKRNKNYCSMPLAKDTRWI